MQPNEKKVWFPTKRYGWGWAPPCSWQGWAVLIIWAIMIFVGLLLLKNHPVISIIYLFVLILALYPDESLSKCWWWKRRNKLSHLRLGWTYVNRPENEFMDGLSVGRAAAGHCDRRAGGWLQRFPGIRFNPLRRIWPRRASRALSKGRR